MFPGVDKTRLRSIAPAVGIDGGERAAEFHLRDDGRERAMLIFGTREHVKRAFLASGDVNRLIPRLGAMDGGFD